MFVQLYWFQLYYHNSVHVKPNDCSRIFNNPKHFNLSSNQSRVYWFAANQRFQLTGNIVRLKTKGHAHSRNNIARKLALSAQPKGFACLELKLFRVCLPSLIWSVQRPSLAQNSFTHLKVYVHSPKHIVYYPMIHHATTTQCLGYCLLYPRSISFLLWGKLTLLIVHSHRPKGLLFAHSLGCIANAHIGVHFVHLEER